jgi:hypothetical protein
LLAEGKTVAQIARFLRLQKSTVSYHKQRLGLPMRADCRRRYDWAEVQAYYDQGHSIRACCLHFGFTAKSWHDAFERGAVRSRPRATPLDKLLRANTPRGRHNIKQRLIAEGVKPNRCEACGISEWRGVALSLSLHHVNGDGRDNRLQNLALLCPNCHSQTPNFGVRNWRAVRATQRRG